MSSYKEPSCRSKKRKHKSVGVITLGSMKRSIGNNRGVSAWYLLSLSKLMLMFRKRVVSWISIWSWEWCLQLAPLSWSSLRSVWTSRWGGKYRTSFNNSIWCKWSTTHKNQSNTPPLTYNALNNFCLKMSSVGTSLRENGRKRTPSTLTSQLSTRPLSLKKASRPPSNSSDLCPSSFY